MTPHVPIVHQRFKNFSFLIQLNPLVGQENDIFFSSCLSAIFEPSLGPRGPSLPMIPLSPRAGIQQKECPACEGQLAE